MKRFENWALEFEYHLFKSCIFIRERERKKEEEEEMVYGASHLGRNCKQFLEFYQYRFEGTAYSINMVMT